MKKPRFPVPLSLALALGGLVFGLGGLVLVGWHTHRPALIQLNPAAVPMQYNTALCFLLSGAGLIAITLGWLRLALGCGGVVGVLGALTGTQYILGTDFGLDQLFMYHYITVQVIDPGRMAPNTTVCFTLSGLALLLAATRQERWHAWEAVGLLGTVTATLGLVAVIGYWTDLAAAYHWFRYTRIAVQTAIGFIGIGFGLTALAWYHTASRIGVMPKWLMWAAGLGGMVLTVVLWIAYAVLNHGQNAFAEQFHPIDWLVLGLGTAMTAAMVATAWMAHTAQERLRLLKMAHDSLRASEQNLAITLNAIGDGVIVTDQTGHVTRMNPVAETLTGWPLPEAAMKPLPTVFPLINAITRQPVVDPVDKVIRSGQVEGLANHTILITRDGRERQIADSAAPILDATQQVVGVVLVFRDVTEEYRARQEIEHSAQRLRREKDVQVALARLSKTFLAAQGLSVAEIAQGVLATSLAVTASQNGFVDEIDPLTGLTSPCTQVGESLPPQLASDRLLAVPVISNGRTVAQVAVANRVRDYTPDDRLIMERIADLFAIVLERVKLERQLRHAGRLEAVGTLAGGIAHDFNNILAIIIGNLELVTFGVSKLEDVRKNISDAANRGRDLVRQLLTFSRQTGSERQRINPAPLVREVLQLMRSTLPTSIAIRAEIRDENLHMFVDATLLYQVIMNLCTNAGQAIGEASGTITVEVEPVHMEEEQARLLQIGPGHYILISVMDNGPGISPEVMERIFEPFFTTKRIGQGTGLGLAVVHGAVQGCGGKVHVESTPGAGTIFRVYIPALDTQAQPDVINNDAEYPEAKKR
ncbi:MAG: PAS domain-containing protein [Magnetococcales bacterium]|nr:PAS domain-containing protein [Magnetococcales bacterium]